MSTVPPQPYAGRHGSVEPVVEPDRAAIDAAWAATVPPPRTTSYWETPPGFIPQRAPRRRLSGLSIALAVVVTVAVLGVIAIVAYQVLSPKPTTSGVPVAVGTVPVRSALGHFEVRMSDVPVPRVVRRQASGRDVLFVAEMDMGAREIVGMEQFRPGLPLDHVDTGLREFAAGAAGTDQLGRVDATTYRGHQAVKFEVHSVSTAGQILVVLWSAHRLYVFGAPDGATLQALTSTFVALP